MRRRGAVLSFANLFAAIDTRADREQLVTLLERPGVRIERIVSTGQASPPGFWYDPAEGEWVIVLRGRASLRFEDESRARVLGPGDFVDIVPRRRHRVEWTALDEPTVWLAVHYAADRGPAGSGPD
ncbi:MAG: cupin domain-containing protein [Burkholderiales bacterium]|nr:cupin domain-containing protein [Burkholderiales bacterium]